MARGAGRWPADVGRWFADGVRWHADSVRGDDGWRAGRRQMVRGSANGSWAGAGRWRADDARDRQVAHRWRAAIAFSSLELTYFGKRNIYQAKWACGS